MGPIGPRGFNGSQGPPGPMGSIGPAGPNGTGDLSTCQYKTKKAVETAGDPLTTIALHEPFVSMHSSKLSCMLSVYVSKIAYLRASNGLSLWARKYIHAEQAICKYVSTLNRLVFCMYSCCNDFQDWFSRKKQKKKQKQNKKQWICNRNSKHNSVSSFPSPMKWEERSNCGLDLLRNFLSLFSHHGKYSPF